MKDYNKIRVGILGMGGMGCKYARLMMEGKVPGMELAAVTRICRDQREEMLSLLPPNVQVFNSAEELLACDNMDAVVVCLPHDLHEEVVTRALDRGLHVLCEKPLGLSAAQAERMRAKAAEKGKLLAVILQQRTLPVWRWLHEVAANQTYGALKRVNYLLTGYYRPDCYYVNGKWRSSWERGGGGLLFNQCVHGLDMLQWICGMPSRVQAFCHEGKWHDIEVEDDVTAYLEFPGGATGIFVASTGEAPGRRRFEISLEKAQILVENGQVQIFELTEDEKEFRKNSADAFGCPKGEWRTKPMPEEKELYAAVLNNFAEAILEGKPLIADGKDGLGSILLAEGMYLSSWQHQMISLPFEESDYQKAFEAHINR
ncbi:MAG: Gfo/Idh/MocA family oxidoreductase [Lachnospiraceae bacterium]|nr:Gfo/Idh/MocA family oxidoreductase [Lachnospiraceae bacterium]